MKKYIAAKPCTFGGKNYIVGDTIPGKAIDPSRVRALVKFGTIHEIEAKETAKEPKEPTTTPAEPDGKEAQQ